MPDRATIFLADPSLLTPKLFDAFEEIEAYEPIGEEETPAGVRFKLAAGDVEATILPEDQLEPLLERLCERAQQVVQGDERLLYTLSRITHVQCALECVATPDWDEADALREFLLDFNGALNGLLAAWDSIIDFDGEPLGGALADEAVEETE
jgi:hypothetical protein